MSRIISYPYDNSIKAKDAWVGTDEASRKTKQYTAEALAEYLNISGSISIIGQMTYKYGTTPLNGIGTLAVFGGGPSVVAFSAVVKLTLSNQDISNQRVVEFLDLLVGSDILITEQGAISTFGYYSIDSYATNATDANYYDLGVTFKSGNGSMISDKIYEAQNFVLANDATQSPWNTVPDGISYTAANVGIGTTSPSSKLEVSGNLRISDDGTNLMTISNESAEDYLSIFQSSNNKATLTFGDVDEQYGTLFTVDVENEEISLFTNGTTTIGDNGFGNSTKFVVDDVNSKFTFINGNVGIGTTSPSAKLHLSDSASGGNPSFILQDNARSGAAALNYILLTDSLNANQAKIGYLSGLNTDLTLQNLVGSTSLVSSGQIKVTAGTNTIFENSGSEKMRISSSGAIKFNTYTAGTLVSDASGNITVSSGGGAGGPYLPLAGGTITGTVDAQSFRTTIGSTDYSLLTRNSSNTAVYIQQAGSGNIVDFRYGSQAASGGTSAMYINGSGNSIFSGNVGIGTTSPAEKLHVNGEVRVDGNDGIAAKKIRSSYFSSIQNLDLQTGSSADIILTTRNVGIGTTSPSEKLDVEGNIRVGVNNGFYINNQNVGIKRDSNDLVVGGFGGIRFTSSSTTVPNQTERMRILANGNVGIGTTNPFTQLEVKKDSYTEARVRGNSDVYKHLSLAHSGDFAYVSGSRSRLILQSGDATYQYPMNFYTGGSVRMVINETGNVGIGTTSPSEKLEVAGNIKASNGASYASITPSGSVGSLYTRSQSVEGAIVSTVSNGNTFASQDVYTGVNIGSFNGAGTVTIGAFNYGNVNYQTGHNSFTHSWYGSRANDPWLTLNATGLGIGTTSPTDKLHIADSDPRIKIVDTDGTNWESQVFTQGGALKLQARNGTNFGNISFQGDNGTNQSEYARFNSIGNFGIGTTSPSYKLEVDGTSRITGRLTLGGNVNNFIEGSASSVNFKSNGEYYFKKGADTNLIITSSGKVGIGTTTPGTALDVVGSLKLRGTNNLTIGSSNSGGDFSLSSGIRGYKFSNQNGDLLRIDSSGKVGIGTTSPSQKLEVDGEVLSDGYRLSAMQTAPAARNSAGTLGEIRITSTYIYVCYATDSWSRVALDTSW